MCSFVPDESAICNLSIFVVILLFGDGFVESALWRPCEKEQRKSARILSQSHSVVVWRRLYRLEVGYFIGAALLTHSYSLAKPRNPRHFDSIET